MARQYVQLSPNNCRLESKSLPSNKNSRMNVDGGDGFRGVGGPTFRMCLLVVENLANFTDRTMPFGFRVEWNFRSKSGRVIKSAYYIITSSVAELAVGSATPTRTHTGPSTKRNSLSPSCLIKGTVCVCVYMPFPSKDITIPSSTLCIADLPRSLPLNDYMMSNSELRTNLKSRNLWIDHFNTCMHDFEPSSFLWYKSALLWRCIFKRFNLKKHITSWSN